MGSIHDQPGACWLVIRHVILLFVFNNVAMLWLFNFQIFVDFIGFLSMVIYVVYIHNVEDIIFAVPSFQILEYQLVAFPIMTTVLSLLRQLKE